MFAKDLCFQHITAESDCKELIVELSRSSNSPSQFRAIVEDCLFLSREFGSCDFTHIRRQGNRVAHELAKIACNNPEATWIEEHPVDIVLLLFLDCNHLSS